MNDPQLVAEFEAMARDLEDGANDPAGLTTRAARCATVRRQYQTFDSIH
jgi:hypothetical protein